MEISTILDFWFGTIAKDGTVEAAKKSAWFKKDPEFDKTVKKQFEPTLVAIESGSHRDWVQSPKGAVAFILVVDQFTRNIYRNHAKAFALDPLAQQVCLSSVENDFLAQLSPYEQAFLLMPTMHAEDLRTQQKGVELFQNLSQEVADPLKEAFESFAKFAVAHKVIIERFGRFPHRNAILERTSTDEEIEFLKQPGSSF